MPGEGKAADEVIKQGKTGYRALGGPYPSPADGDAGKITDRGDEDAVQGDPAEGPG